MDEKTQKNLSILDLEKEITCIKYQITNILSAIDELRNRVD